MATFIVMRQHVGDRDYRPGERRDADPAQVAHLVAAGVLKPVGNAAPENKRAAKPEPKSGGQK